MPFAGYTTTVEAVKTAGDVTAMLASAGARRIMTEYTSTGRPEGMSFEIETKYGVQAFTLPIKTKAVHAVLKRQKLQPRYQTIEHAERVAWRVAHDWLRNQLALIEAEMVSLDEVMFPWMIGSGGQTMHSLFVQNSLGQLEA